MRDKLDLITAEAIEHEIMELIKTRKDNGVPYSTILLSLGVVVSRICQEEEIPNKLYYSSQLAIDCDTVEEAHRLVDECFKIKQEE